METKVQLLQERNELEAKYADLDRKYEAAMQQLSECKQDLQQATTELEQYKSALRNVLQLDIVKTMIQTAVDDRIRLLGLRTKHPEYQDSTELQLLFDNDELDCVAI